MVNIVNVEVDLATAKKKKEKKSMVSLANEEADLVNPKKKKKEK